MDAPSHSRWIRRPCCTRKGHLLPEGGPVEPYEPLSPALDHGHKLLAALLHLDPTRRIPLEDFTTRWGPLGLLHHGLIAARYVEDHGELEALHDPPVLLDRAETTFMPPAAAVRWKMCSDDERDSAIQLGLDDDGFAFPDDANDAMGYDRCQEYVAELADYEERRWRADRRSRAQALVWEHGNSSAPGVVDLATYLATYFPNYPQPQNGARRFPAPTSGAFWNHYSEPVRAVRNAILLFQSDFAIVSAASTTEERRRAGQIIERHTVSVTPRLDTSGALTWRFPSLLAAGYLAMLLHAAPATNRGEQLKSCSGCGALFTGRSNRRYCTTRCRNAAEKRRERARTSPDRASHSRAAPTRAPTRVESAAPSD